MFCQASAHQLLLRLPHHVVEVEDGDLHLKVLTRVRWAKARRGHGLAAWNGLRLQTLGMHVWGIRCTPPFARMQRIKYKLEP